MNRWIRLEDRTEGYGEGRRAFSYALNKSPGELEPVPAGGSDWLTALIDL